MFSQQSFFRVLPVVAPSLRATLRSFSTDDGDGSENVTLKMSYHFFKRYRVYSNSLEMSYSRKRRLISSSGKVNVSSTPSTWSWRSHLCVKENLRIALSFCLLIYSFYNLLEKSLFRCSLRWCSVVVLLQISHLYGLLLTFVATQIPWRFNAALD